MAKAQTIDPTAIPPESARDRAAELAQANQVTPRGAARLLDQATWGPTPAAIAQVQQLGITNWLNQQFALNTSDLPDQPILDPTTGNANENLAPVNAAFFANAITGSDQLRQRVAWALYEILVVSQVSVKNAYAFPPYWRIFRDNAFGNYRDLLQAVSLSPAMGAYLNMANNNKANTSKGTAANENYARELMQLFTLGLTGLNPDGSAVVDSSGNPVPTYNQAEVTQLAKAFTGWTYPLTPGATAKSNNPAYYFGQMSAVEAEHDTTSKAIFGGLTIPAGQTAEADLNTVLNDLMAQPTMAPFISAQLIQHLVTSNPSPAYIQRVSSVFSNDGTGTKGNLQAVIRAILTDSEARAGDNPNTAANPNFGHLREPVLFMTNVLRGLNASLGASSVINNQTNQLGQNLFNPGSVFSYFSPQNRTEKGLLGPEFQIYTTQTVANRADIVYQLLYTKLDSTTTINLAPFIGTSNTLDQILAAISSVFLHEGMSTSLYNAAYTAAAAAGKASTAPNKSAVLAEAALYIVLTSGEYQIIQ